MIKRFGTTDAVQDVQKKGSDEQAGAPPAGAPSSISRAHLGFMLMVGFRHSAMELAQWGELGPLVGE